jgi:hypothetical protein
MSYRVFISYPRIADRRWAVTDLQGHLQAELKLKTGARDLVVFMDSASLEAGDNWSEELERQLRCSDVIVVLLAPLWLSSEICRRELQVYGEARMGKGLPPIVVPLLWDETAARDAVGDEQEAVLRFLLATHHHDWRDFKYQHSRDATYMPAVGRLAQHVANKLRESPDESMRNRSAARQTLAH